MVISARPRPGLGGLDGGGAWGDGVVVSPFADITGDTGQFMVADLDRIQGRGAAEESALRSSLVGGEGVAVHLMPTLVENPELAAVPWCVCLHWSAPSRAARSGASQFPRRAARPCATGGGRLRRPAPDADGPHPSRSAPGTIPARRRNRRCSRRNSRHDESCQAVVPVRQSCCRGGPLRPKGSGCSRFPGLPGKDNARNHKTHRSGRS